LASRAYKYTFKGVYKRKQKSARSTPFPNPAKNLTEIGTRVRSEENDRSVMWIARSGRGTEEQSTPLQIQPPLSPIPINSPAAAVVMDAPYVFDRVWEFLDPTSAPQLRLVSRSWRDALAAVPRELLRVEDYLSSASLFVWARRELRMPERADIAVLAARGAHLEVLQWLRAKKGRCSWTSSVCESAARQGHLHVLEWLRTRRPPCPWDAGTCDAAAFGGHLDLLQWLRSRRPPCPWDEGTCHGAARGGHLVVLQWLRAQDPPCPWNEVTCGCAAAHVHLDVLQWMRAQDPPCPWNEWTCAWAAAEGQVEVLQWLRAQDPPCPWTEATCRLCCRKRSGGGAAMAASSGTSLSLD
jgi:hypothetical protein